MRYCPLFNVRSRLQVGSALPFNVYNGDLTLLLARGHDIASQTQLENLLARDALVDLVELHRGREGIQAAPPELLPELWNDCGDRLRRILGACETATLHAALDEAAEPVHTLIERDPDLAIVQVVRQEGNEHTRYGLHHAIHAAIAAWLVAARLAWDAADAQRAFKAALTMNLSIFELQGLMAGRAGAPDAQQRQQIDAHPRRSRELLELAGVNDPAWLLAVQQHHERTGGHGYPDGIGSPCMLATLLQRVDVFTTRLSPRAYRDALPADEVVRELFASERDSPIVTALVKEFGVYPPGCHVKLASGETAIVVRRGEKVMAPLVRAVLDRNDRPLDEPRTRDTGHPSHAVTGLVAQRWALSRLQARGSAAGGH